MKIYIMSDMEGVAGVVNAADHLAPGARYYETARMLTTLEVNAAIEGALEEGATDFLVADGHGHGAIDPVLLHPAACLLTGKPSAYPFGCDETFDVAFNIGQHAKANADGGHLSHTGMFTVDDLTINGQSVGELGCNMLFCGHFGVPMIFVAGDEACALEADQLMPGIETATVKWGLRRGSATGLSAEEYSLFNGAAIHRSPEQARATIRAGARRALQGHREGPKTPFRMSAPYELVCTLRPSLNSLALSATVRSNDVLQLLQSPREFKPL